MINNALSQIAMQLNQHFKQHFQVGEDTVVLSNIMELDGSLAPHCMNKVVIFLTGIRTAHNTQLPCDDLNQQIKPIKSSHKNLNLMVMCAANFSGNNYSESLKFLSSAVEFFQEHPILDHDNTPGLPPQIDKLTLSIEDLSISEMNNLWSIHSGRYLPSILYQVRMVCADCN